MGILKFTPSWRAWRDGVVYNHNQSIVLCNLQSVDINIVDFYVTLDLTNSVAFFLKRLFSNYFHYKKEIRDIKNIEVSVTLRK